MYTFTVSTPSYVAVTLGAVDSAATGQPLGSDLTLGLGTPTGSTCTATTTSDAVAQLSAQISQQLVPGTYCVNVSDGGALPETAAIAGRITTTSAVPASSGTTTTDTISSMVVAGGTAEHTFRTSSAGSATLLLTSVATGAVVRMSLGLWDGSACRLTVSTDTIVASEPEIAENLDQGQYCIRVQDLDPAGRSNFSVLITHP